MTKKERQRESAIYIRKQKLFEKQYLKPVFLALKNQVNEVVHILRTRGIGEAKKHNDTTILNERMAKIIQSMYKNIGVYFANENYGQLRRQIQKGFGFNQDWINEIISYFQVHLLSDAVLPITDTTKDQIRQALIEGEQQGLGVDEIARKLQSDELWLWRARMIVRTESQKAAFYGRKLGADKIEYETTSEWIAANDHRVRHSHHDVDGDIIDTGAKFKVPRMRGKFQIGYDMMSGPGDPKASAGNVINCRCTTAERIKFDEKGRPVLKTNILG